VNQVATVGAAVSIPVVWSFLGFDIQAGPAIVGVCAVIITRLIVTLNSKGRRRIALDVLVTALCALLTLLWIQAHTLDLLKSGVTGIGIASAGLGMIGIAKSALLGPLRAGIRAAIHAADNAGGDPRP
jgi:small neutral amino acid transporter SnatA (MarC family)